jgi:hypothetical protein
MPSCVAQSSARKDKYFTGAVRVSTLDELRVGVWDAMSATGYAYAWVFLAWMKAITMEVAV